MITRDRGEMFCKFIIFTNIKKQQVLNLDCNFLEMK